MTGSLLLQLNILELSNRYTGEIIEEKRFCQYLKIQRFLTDWGAENKIPHPREDQKNSSPRPKAAGRNFLIFPRVRNFILRPPIREESDSYTVYCAYHRLQINKNTHRHKKIGWKMTFQWNKNMPRLFYSIKNKKIPYVMNLCTRGITNS